MRISPKMILVLIALSLIGCGASSDGESATAARNELATVPNEQRPVESRPVRVDGMKSISELDSAAAFRFIIMSDNKGEASSTHVGFARMVAWTRDGGDRFAIGLGDHLKKRWRPTTFLKFLAADPWWRDNFYPNVADGENEYYGRWQSDWGAGRQFLTDIGLNARANVSMRKNGCEYYAKIVADAYTVHLIQLHFSDNPRDPAKAFREDSRAYLASTVKAIAKGPKDVIIAAAHSRTGFWHEHLSPEQRRIVFGKCDVLLSATTHQWAWKEVPAVDGNQPLIVNTGSITFPKSGHPAGYVQVHVLPSPTRLVVSYIHTAESERKLPPKGHSFLKTTGGPVKALEF